MRVNIWLKAVAFMMMTMRNDDDYLEGEVNELRFRTTQYSL